MDLDAGVLVYPGIRGTRVLASALADVLLRHKGIRQKVDGRGTMTLKRRVETWGNKPGRVWLPAEVKKAQAMRAAGLSSEEIGRVLNRTTRSVNAKLGHQGPRQSFRSAA